MTSLAEDVDINQVHALLLARNPAILEDDSEDHAYYLSSVNGITTEVAAITGADVAPGPYRDLAVWAITLGVAAQIESALYPEQQLGDNARAQALQARYEQLLTRLGAAPEAGGTVPSVARPVGSFPAARPYPDAAEPYDCTGLRYVARYGD